MLVARWTYKLSTYVRNLSFLLHQARAQHVTIHIGPALRGYQLETPARHLRHVSFAGRYAHLPLWPSHNLWKFTLDERYSK